MHVEVAFLPRDATRLPERIALVIDVIRATTTLVTMFERGARSVALANDVLSARSAAALEMAQAVGADISVVCAGRAGGTQQGLDDLIRIPLQSQQAEIESVFFETGVGQGLSRLDLADNVRFCAAMM